MDIRFGQKKDLNKLKSKVRFPVAQGQRSIQDGKQKTSVLIQVNQQNLIDTNGLKHEL